MYIRLMGVYINYENGQGVGKCTFLKDLNNRGKSRYAVFKCKCGNEFSATIQNVKTEKIKSCGCALAESKGNYKHGFSPKSSGRNEYTSYVQMMNRCYKTTDPNYLRYGAKGITVCDSWRENFVNFITDMGKKPTQLHSLDRKDYKGNYEPSNCRWATRTEQNRNTSRNNMVEYKGQIKCIADWCDILCLNYKRTYQRVFRNKWTVEKAFTHQ